MARRDSGLSKRLEHRHKELTQLKRHVVLAHVTSDSHLYSIGNYAAFKLPHSIGVRRSQKHVIEDPIIPGVKLDLVKIISKIISD